MCQPGDVSLAEEVLRSPALHVHRCISKEFYNTVSTTDTVGTAGEVLITYSNWLWLLADFQRKSG